MGARSLNSYWKKAAAAVVTIGTALAIGTAAPAEAAAPRTNSLTNAYAASTPYSYLRGAIWSGAYVTMHCWEDNVWADGTNRWFKVTGPGWDPRTGRAASIHGFVPATRIINQVSVGHC
jgi:hypothetical protein